MLYCSSGGSFTIVGNKCKRFEIILIDSTTRATLSDSPKHSDYKSNFSDMLLELVQKNLNYHIYYANNFETSVIITNGGGFTEEESLYLYPFESLFDLSYFPNLKNQKNAILKKIDFYTIQLGAYKNKITITDWLNHEKNRNLLKQIIDLSDKFQDKFEMFYGYDECSGNALIPLYIKKDSKNYFCLRYGFFASKEKIKKFIDKTKIKYIFVKDFIELKDFNKYWRSVDLDTLEN